MKNTQLNESLAISKLAVAIEYLTWAQQAKTPKEKIKWLNEANHMIDQASYWIYKEMPF